MAAKVKIKYVLSSAARPKTMTLCARRAFCRTVDDRDDESPPSDLQPEFSPSSPFPALPSIRSHQIETQVFTHRSLYGRPGHVFEDLPHDPSPDNEKYEHLGDSVLNMIVTHVLYETHPYLRVGPSTKIRSLVVGNNTLADISRRYGLPARLRLHPAQTITLRTSLNVQADVFESYVGGLYLDQGLFAVHTWLKALFMPYVREACTRVRTQHGLPPLPSVGVATSDGPTDGEPTPTSVAHFPTGGVAGPDPGPAPVLASKSTPAPVTPPSLTVTPSDLYRPLLTEVVTTTGHLALFNQLLQKARIFCEWEYTNGNGEGVQTTPIWIATAKVGTEQYGSGRGSTKKAARNEAAKVGLVKLGIVV